ncbi:MAG: aspartate aminotransferase family protein [Firmicutes bacterium]|nr:aspartate aminotransferase family protein [Alicyclobacillaceae bacterium]MCL6496077.1 aspartate aminotransferase family protein [Bacillota bacterium]
MAEGVKPAQDPKPTGRPSAAALYDRYVAHSFLAPEPLEVARAEGAYVWDAAGRRYIDCFAGISVVNVGHGHPAVREAVRAQVDRLIHCNSYTYYVWEVGRLAQRLAEVIPGPASKTFFSNSGAEAVEAALRMAKAYTGRSEFVALTRGFHGRTLGALGVTGNAGRRHRGGPFAPGVAFAPAPIPRPGETVEEAAARAIAGMEEVFRYGTSGQVAAVIVEPVLGEGGIWPLPAEYWAALKPLVERWGALLVVDEVQTGFGRTGRLFACQHFGLEPDIVVLAKGIADGFPLGATVARPEIADSLGPGEHLSTFGGNPVSVAAALATLEVLLAENLPQQAATKGAWALEHLRGWAQTRPEVAVRGLGLMIGIELRDQRGEARPDWAREVRAQAREAGVLIGVGGPEGNVLRLQPPLVIAQADWNQAVQVVKAALDTVLEQAAAPGAQP